MAGVTNLLNTVQQQVLDVLEAQFGGRIDYHRLISSVTDVETGDRVIDQTVIPIPCAIILPTKRVREAEKSISVISANKKFVQGGGYDVGTKDFIVRGSYLTSIGGVQQDDWIIYGTKKFEIISWDEYEFEGSYLITAKELRGSNA